MSINVKDIFTHLILYLISNPEFEDIAIKLSLSNLSIISLYDVSSFADTFKEINMLLRNDNNGIPYIRSIILMMMN